MLRRSILKLFAVCLCGISVGCSNLSYYMQSAGGQLRLMSQREPIAELLARPGVSAELKSRLATILRIRDFASQELGLPDNGSYRSYVDTGRRYIVWNVFAAPALSLQPKEWCFLIVGCVSYRGYFDQARAVKFAEMLRRDGYDVYVAGISAYSTLGWFDDPLPNTVLNRPDADVAALIFHELAHQQLFIEDDTAFNESFATTVEIEGARRWLRQQNDARAYAAYLERRQRRQQFTALLQSTRDELETIYASTMPDDEKVRRKRQVFTELRARYQALKRGWGGYDGYDRWFEQPLNNARLVPVAAYHTYVAAFQALLGREEGNLPAFYRAAAELGARPPAERAAALAALGAASQPRRASER